MNKIYPIFVTIICALIVFVNAYAMGNDTNQHTALVITTILMFLSILSSWVVYNSVNTAISASVNETPAEPDTILLKITVRNNRDGKDFTYASDNQYGLNYSYEFDRRGQEFLRITKETKNGSLNLAILTEHDVTDVKYGFGTPETVK